MAMNSNKIKSSYKKLSNNRLKIVYRKNKRIYIIFLNNRIFASFAVDFFFKNALRLNKCSKRLTLYLFILKALRHYGLIKEFYILDDYPRFKRH